MIKCIVVDDEPLARSLLEGHIGEVPFLEHLGSFKDGVEAIDFLRTTTVDVIFLDIQMPKLTGIDVLKTITSPPKVIFTTAYREYALESYEYEAVDYLLKPVTFTRFFKAVNKLLPVSEDVGARTHVPPVEHIYVAFNKKRIKVMLDQVLYIESVKDYIRIHLEDKRLVVKEQLGRFAEQLPAHFLRTHRSYVVNTNKITAYTALDVEIGDKEIPIGGKYKEYVFGLLNAMAKRG